MSSAPTSADIPDSSKLHVTITSGTDVVWEGSASSISSTNSEGPFDVLPQHANFITLVEKFPIVVKMGNQQLFEHTFSHAVLYVQQDIVRIYGDIT